jgi:hypothetical protein
LTFYVDGPVDSGNMSKSATKKDQLTPVEVANIRAFLGGTAEKRSFDLLARLVEVVNHNNDLLTENKNLKDQVYYWKGLAKSVPRANLPEMLEKAPAPGPVVQKRKPQAKALAPPAPKKQRVDAPPQLGGPPRAGLLWDMLRPGPANAGEQALHNAANQQLPSGPVQVVPAVSAGEQALDNATDQDPASAPIFVDDTPRQMDGQPIAIAGWQLLGNAADQGPPSGPFFVDDTPRQMVVQPVANAGEQASGNAASQELLSDPIMWDDDDLGSLFNEPIDLTEDGDTPATSVLNTPMLDDNGCFQTYVL